LQLPEQAKRNSWQFTLIPVIWVIVSVGAFLWLDLFREANLKFLLPAQVGFALWVGRGVWTLWNLRPRRESPYIQMVPKLASAAGVLAVVVTLWSGLDPLYHDPEFQRSDYRGIVETINQRADAGDAVILDAPNQQEVFEYYYNGILAVYPLPVGLGGDDQATFEATREIIADHPRIFAVFWGTEERDPNHIVESTLDSEAYEADDVWYGDVRLVQYVAPIDFESFEESGAQFGESITLEQFALSAETVQPGDVLQAQFHWTTAKSLDARYKVFLQLLNVDGVLAAQRDSEPGGGQFPTTGWSPDETIIDNHALMIPDDLPPSHYTLIIGLYNPDDPLARLPVGDGEFLILGEIVVE
jgi:hypothetical protein